MDALSLISINNKKEIPDGFCINLAGVLSFYENM
jgi:hypothetical protein